MRPFNWQQFNESEMPSEAGTVLRRFANGEKLTVARVSFAADSPMRTRMGSLRSSSPARWSSRSTATPVTVREGEFVHMSPNVPHGARSIGEAVVLGVFTPIRADWKD
jgi:hypothetical protein